MRGAWVWCTLRDSCCGDFCDSLLPFASDMVRVACHDIRVIVITWSSLDIQYVRIIVHARRPSAWRLCPRPERLAHILSAALPHRS